MPFYFRQATKTFRRLGNSASDQALLVKELKERGASETSAQAAVAKTAERWRGFESYFYDSELRFEHDGKGALRVNAVARLALNFLAVHRALVEIEQDLSQEVLGDLPLASFRDLVLLAVATFFEQDRSQNLWRLDEYLTLQVKPLCRELARIKI